MELQIDWDDLFDFDVAFSGDANNCDPSFVIPSSSPNQGDNQSPLSVDDIEQLLFNDDDDQVPTGDSDGFLNDILLDSPIEGDKSGEVVDLSDSAEDTKNEADAKDYKEENENSNHDPLAKKRKRQQRNKDAALRSRERKKMYVKDLEMKSKYFEGECRRLGSLLQWYMAENQALRFSLHSSNSGSNVSMTKQESAVLLLESLLLGSLLWLMGMVVVLPSLVLLLTLHQLQNQLVEEKHLPSPALRKGGSKALLIGKRFKASRSRMRPFCFQFVSRFLIFCGGSVLC